MFSMKAVIELVKALAKFIMTLFVALMVLVGRHR
jgi:flagellar biosynthetic protein FlhB